MIKNIDLATTVQKLNNQMIQFKATQVSGGDSFHLYKFTLNDFPNHTARIIPEINDAVNIFCYIPENEPSVQADAFTPIPMSGVEWLCVPYPPFNTEYWQDVGPRGGTIYSNRPFTVEMSNQFCTGYGY